MSTIAPPPAVVVALEHLIDYAGLFPPAKLSLREALEQYDRAAAGGHAWMLGRFILPAASLEELHELRPDEAALKLSVIVDADEKTFERLWRVRQTSAWTIEALEVPGATPERCAALCDRFGFTDVPVYVELGAADRSPAQLDASMAALARFGLHAKLRCGGLEPAAYPSVGEVAAFVIAAARAGVPFKATAGLHHPVRHYNAAAGVTMHGFLNLLAAAAFAGHAPAETIEAILAEEDASAFAFGDELRWRDRHADETALRLVRSRRFVGYGSCSFEEPVDDLRALNVLAS